MPSSEYLKKSTPSSCYFFSCYHERSDYCQQDQEVGFWVIKSCPKLNLGKPFFTSELNYVNVFSPLETATQV